MYHLKSYSSSKVIFRNKLVSPQYSATDKIFTSAGFRKMHFTTSYSLDIPAFKTILKNVHPEQQETN